MWKPLVNIYSCVRIYTKGCWMLYESTYWLCLFSSPLSDSRRSFFSSPSFRWFFLVSPFLIQSPKSLWISTRTRILTVLWPIQVLVYPVDLLFYKHIFDRQFFHIPRLLEYSSWPFTDAIVSIDAKIIENWYFFSPLRRGFDFSKKKVTGFSHDFVIIYGGADVFVAFVPCTFSKDFDREG